VRVRLRGRAGGLRRAAAALTLPLALGACAGGDDAAPAAAPAAGRAALAADGAPALAGADVLLVTLDTLRHDALGFAGRADVATPTLDRLAAAGRVFPMAHAHTVTTLPSHTNILTGLYPYQHGVRENAGFVLGDDVPTLATILRARGYATAAVVGAFPLDSRFGLDRGFDLYDDAYPQGADGGRLRFAERRGDEVVRRALDWWQRTPGRKFLWAHLFDAHAPYAPAPEFAVRHPRQPYYGEVEAIDSYLAPLLAPLLDGTGRPTLVVVTADHGEGLGDHGELTHGLFAYEPTLRVPLLVWYPGIAPGRDLRPAAHVDILPSVLAALGLPAVDGLPGRSLWTPPGGEPRRIYFEALATYFNRGWAPLRGLVAGGHKAIALPIPELYDLAADAGESRNLVDAERRRYHELVAALPESPPWPPGQRTIDGEEAARLRSLGYLSAAPAVGTRFGPDDDPKRLIDVDRKIHESIDAYARGELETTLRLSRELIAARPEMPLAYEQAAIVLRDLARPREAIEVMETAVARGAADASLLRQLGLTLAEVGRAAEAVELLRPLATEADLEAINGLAVALSDAGRHDEALTTLARLFAVDPDDAPGLETLGVVELRRSRPAAAREALERALERNPNLPRAWNTLGVAHAYEERFVEAIAAWERALALDPGLEDTLYNVGLTAARLGDVARSRAALTRYLAVTRPDRDPAAVANARRLLASLP